MLFQSETDTLVSSAHVALSPFLFFFSEIGRKWERELGVAARGREITAVPVGKTIRQNQTSGWKCRWTQLTVPRFGRR
jgi:hypothetical protein